MDWFMCNRQYRLFDIDFWIYEVYAFLPGAPGTSGDNCGSEPRRGENQNEPAKLSER
jgi:hypothetical protein